MKKNSKVKVNSGNLTRAKINEVVQRIPEKELRSFVSMLATDPHVKPLFARTFEPYLLMEETLEEYLHQIFATFSAARDKYDSVPLSHQLTLSSSMRNILNAAERYRDAGQFENAIEICFQIARETADVLGNSDDSLGYLGEMIREAFTILRSMVGIGAFLFDDEACPSDDEDCLSDDEPRLLDENGRLWFIESCWDCIFDGVFEGWNWHLDIYRFLYHLAEDDEEFEEILDFLENDSYLQDAIYQQEVVQLKQELLTKWKQTALAMHLRANESERVTAAESLEGITTAEAAREFVYHHLHVPAIREMAIQDALLTANYPQAYHLCQGGIRQSCDPDLIDRWHQWQLTAAKEEGNKALIIESASHLLQSNHYQPNDIYHYQPVDCNHHLKVDCRHHQSNDCYNHLTDEYYQLLKEAMPAEEWPAYVRQLAEQLPPEKDTLYMEICAKEGWKDELYSRLQGMHISTCFAYESALLPEYGEQLADRYISHAVQLMNVPHRDRFVYQELCSYLQRAARVGGSERVELVKAELRTTYKKCRALMDELSRV